MVNAKTLNASEISTKFTPQSRAMGPTFKRYLLPPRLASFSIPGNIQLPYNESDARGDVGIKHKDHIREARYQTNPTSRSKMEVDVMPIIHVYDIFKTVLKDVEILATSALASSGTWLEFCCHKDNIVRIRASI